MPAKPTNPLLIELRGVVKTYTSEAGDFTALKGIDLDIHPTEPGRASDPLARPR